MIDINKLLEKIDQPDVFEEDTEDYKPSSCYEVKVEEGKFLFLIDNKEVASYSAEGFSLKYEDVKVLFAQCVEFMKNNDFKGLKKFLKESR